MGRAVVRLARDAGLRIVCAVGQSDVGRDAGELAGVGAIGVPVAAELELLAGAKATVLIDFSHPSATAAMARAAAAAGSAIVSGTTGLDQEGQAALDLAARSVPVLWEPNMSVGVHVLGAIVERAMAMLGLSFDVEITETHHRMKADAPSGTALRLAEAAARARSALSATSRLAHGREGAPRSPEEIGMHALRGGDVIGDHTVHLLGAGERLELTHRATSRELFAQGALRAALWLPGRPPGRHRIADMF